ncbi:MAG: hypothetical protein H0W20_06555 [Chthoniobacterales bacterium]|nr:hypothetical protein [Chthoniobacterales bacterium]
MKRNLLRIGAAGLAMLFASLGSLSAAHLTGLSLFGVTTFGNQLVTIDPMTGAGTVVGSFGDTIFATGLGVRDGRLFAFDQVNDRLREINKVSGALISSIDIGVGNLTGEGALTFRASDGVGFLASPLNANNEPVNDFFMFTIAASGTAGTSVRVGSTGVAIDAMAFNSRGILYAIGQADAILYTINPANGATTAVGPIRVGSDNLIKNSPIAGMTVAPANPDRGGLEEIYASIDDRLFIIDPTTAAARVASADVINFGPFVSSVAGLAFAPGAGTLGNISTRLRVGTGENVGIGGFIVTGAPSKRLIVRGIGPSLTRFQDPLQDPEIEVFNANGVSLARNDDWRQSQEAEIRASGLAPTNDKEAAIIGNLAEGTYTVVLRGTRSTTGVGLVEIYDLNLGNGSRLANLSTRGFVERNENILIGGMIVTGSAAQRVVTRAIGPDLRARGVANPLQDPQVDIFDGNGMRIAGNDNFGTGGQTDELAQNGLTPGDSRDSAIILTVPPGNYTALVTGVGGSTGVALVEFFNLTR